MSETKNKPVISVEGLIARFRENTVFDGVSFEIYKGEIFVILGGSGCGKTTMLKHIIGLYEPYAGSIVVNGVDITTADESEFEEVKRNFGVLFQGGALFGSMTLAENISLLLYEYTNLTADEINDVVKMKLDMVNLSGYENHLPSEISGGMKKRAGLARAMALDPTILFFDEPSAGLDPVTSAELDELIKGINASMGTTMVIVTHELDSIYSIAHRIIMLDKKEKGIIAEGDPRELRDTSSDPRVVNFFKRKIAA